MQDVSIASGEVSDPPTGDDDPLSEQQGALRKQVSPVTAELAAGRNDAMAGHRRIAASRA